MSSLSQPIKSSFELRGTRESLSIFILFLKILYEKAIFEKELLYICIGRIPLFPNIISLRQIGQKILRRERVLDKNRKRKRTGMREIFPLSPLT